MLQMKVGLCYLLFLVLIQQSFSALDGHSNTSGIVQWKCTCSIADQGNRNYAVPENCYSSCDCNPASGVSSEDRWLCICNSEGLPKIAAGDNEPSCFNGCNCSSGTSTEKQTSKKQISSKVVIIILLLCVIVACLVIIASLLCYVYRSSYEQLSFSSDRQMSGSSANSLIGQRVSSSIMHKSSGTAPVKSVAGCFFKPSFIFRNKTGAMHGTIIEFSYYELEIVTNKFSDSNLIGVGGSSRVYRGYLRDGRVVAVKRIKTQEGPDAESVFMTEIELISRLHHCHVVPLLGFCLARHGKYPQRLLVFEYMSNGNLRDCLDGASGKSLDWSRRVTIALGAARGLEYLHEAAAPRILHRDVKSTNVLLDENWRAKITDLGMAKHLENDGIASCSSSPARMQGTFGYFAPEYAIVGKASLKSDVFSFGVVLLELISGRHPIQNSLHRGEESLVIWASPRLQDSRRVISELPDPNLGGVYDEEEMHVMAYLAKECLLLDPDCRPTMGEVVQILSTIAPDKSNKRKNMSVHVFQKSSIGVMRSEEVVEHDLVEAEEIKHVMSDEQQTDRHSPSLSHVSTSSCPGKKKKEADTDSSIKELTLLASKSSCHVQDDDPVHLTEPRLESFCLSKMLKSSSCTIKQQ